MTEELENILYPPPTAVRSIVPMPYGHYQYSAQTGSDYSHSSSTQFQPHSYPNHPPPFYPPIPSVLPQQPAAAGWSWSPEGAWIYRLPPSAPPPMFTDPAGFPFGLSPQHPSSSSDFRANLYQADQYPYPTSPPDTSPPSVYSSKPKSILRSSGADSYRDQWSDPANTSRQVRFRDTPDIAPPHYHSYHSPLSPPTAADLGITITSRQVPRWTLHKKPGDRKRSVSLDSGSHQAPSRNGDWSNHLVVKSRSHSLQDDGTYRSIEVTRSANDTRNNDISEEQVPPILQQAHKRLLDFDDRRTEKSGKRSGRTLIQELERIAEHMPSRHTHPRRLPQSDRYEEESPASVGSANRTEPAVRTQVSQAFDWGYR